MIIKIDKKDKKLYESLPSLEYSGSKFLYILVKYTKTIERFKDLVVKGLVNRKI